MKNNLKLKYKIRLITAQHKLLLTDLINNYQASKNYK